MFDEPPCRRTKWSCNAFWSAPCPTGKTISKWYWHLSKPHLDAITPEMKKTDAVLTAGAQTDMDKIKALFYYVSKNVRYMGLTPEKDRPGFEPHDVKLTFDKKYGVCRDKAGLLVAMLREAGLNAYPVLINVGASATRTCRSPDFNHAIVGVELEKGDYVLMDPTDENTRDLLPSYDCDQSYLVCRPEGENLLTSPVSHRRRTSDADQTTGTLTADGRLAGKIGVVL